MVVVMTAVLLMVGCKKELKRVPKSIIQPTEFTNLIVDLRLAEAFQKSLRHKGYYDINLIDSSYQQIFVLHGYSIEQVETSYDYYTSNPEWMEKITLDAIEEINKKQQ